MDDIQLPPAPTLPPPPYIGKSWKTELKTQMLQMRFSPAEHRLFTDALKKWRERGGAKWIELEGADDTVATFVRDLVFPVLYNADRIVNYFELERPELKALRVEQKRAGEDRGSTPTKIQVVIKASPLDLATVRWKQLQAQNIRSQNQLVMAILLPECLKILLQQDTVEMIRERMEAERLAALEKEMDEIRKQLAEKKEQARLALDADSVSELYLAEVGREIAKLNERVRELIELGASPGALHTRTNSFSKEAAGPHDGFIEQAPSVKKRGRPPGSKNKPKKLSGPVTGL